jgi:putative membrane protein
MTAIRTVHPWSLAAGAMVLAAAWLGPLPALSRHSFTAHMAMHMSVVAVACPLLALGIARGPLDPLRTRDGGWRGVLLSPYVASALEFVVVWAWHAPGLHHLARHSDAWRALEQGSFLGVGMLVWLSALGGGSAARERAAAGIGGLLMTSMHMTLLGVLLALAARPLYGHGAGQAAFGLSALQDQHLGGVVMLAVGGVSYLVGALALLATLLSGRRGEVVRD